MTACPKCGMRLEDLPRTGGKLGCPHDYQIFLEPLLEGIEHIQHELRHTGKVPRRSQLVNDMERAIRQDDFERAAEIKKKLEAIGVAAR